MSLKEQMLKAGLITEEQARRVTHKKRVDNKKTDHKKRAEAKQAALEGDRRQGESRKSADREKNLAQQERQEQKERGHQERQHRESSLSAAYREGAVPNWEGPRRYYYAVRGRIDYLMVNDETSRKLEGGKVAIAASERNPARPCLLHAGAARKLLAVEPDRIWVFHSG